MKIMQTQVNELYQKMQDGDTTIKELGKIISEIGNQTQVNNVFNAVKIEEDMSQADITVSYTGTTLEKVSYVISLLAFIGFIGYVIKEKRKQNEKSN